MTGTPGVRMLRPMGRARSRVGVIVCVVLGACATPIEPAGDAAMDAALDAASDTFLPGRDANADVPAIDTNPPDAGLVEAWTLDDVRTRYCTPLADLLCSTTCSCVTRSFDCTDRGLFVQQCVDSYMGATFDPTLAFDGRRIAATLARRQAYAETCTVDPLTPAARTAGIVAPVGLGQSCALYREGSTCAGGLGLCASGGNCVPAPTSGEPCAASCLFPLFCSAGQCVTPAASGGSCADDLGCEAPLRCLGGHCAALGVAGATCTSADRCEPPQTCDGTGHCAVATDCTVGGSCGFGSTCSADVIGACAALAGLGEPCSVAPGLFDCAAGLACSVRSLTCVPMPALGEPCNDVVAVTLCEPGTTCDGSTCVARVALGASCDGAGPCVEGAWCRGGTSGSTCVALAGLGETCGGPGTCAAGLHCDSTTTTCAGPLADGMRCLDSDGCQSTSYCDATGSCRPRTVSGGPCSETRECASGLECFGVRPEPMACAPPPSVGDRCSTAGVGCGSTLRCVATGGSCACTI